MWNGFYLEEQNQENQTKDICLEVLDYDSKTQALTGQGTDEHGQFSINGCILSNKKVKFTQKSHSGDIRYFFGKLNVSSNEIHGKWGNKLGQPKGSFCLKSQKALKIANELTQVLIKEQKNSCFSCFSKPKQSISKDNKISQELQPLLLTPGEPVDTSETFTQILESLVLSEDGFFDWSEHRQNVVINQDYCFNLLSSENLLKRAPFQYTVKLIESLSVSLVNKDSLTNFMVYCNSFFNQCEAKNHDWNQETDFLNQWGSLMPLIQGELQYPREPYLRVPVNPSKPITVFEIKDANKRYANALATKQFNQLNFVVMLYTIFGPNQIRINNYPKKDVLENMNLQMFAPLSFKSSVCNLGSAVNRRQIPFWNQVAENVFDLNTLIMLSHNVKMIKVTPEKNSKQLEKPEIHVENSSPFSIGLLSLNKNFVKVFANSLWPENDSFYKKLCKVIGDKCSTSLSTLRKKKQEKQLEAALWILPIIVNRMSTKFVKTKMAPLLQDLVKNPLLNVVALKQLEPLTTDVLINNQECAKKIHLLEIEDFYLKNLFKSHDVQVVLYAVSKLVPKSLKCPVEVFIEHPRPEAQSFVDLYKELNLRQLIENHLTLPKQNNQYGISYKIKLRYLIEQVFKQIWRSQQLFMHDEVLELVSMYFEMPDITKIVRALPHIQKEHMAVFFSGKQISITDEDKSYPRSLLQDMKALRFLPKPQNERQPAPETGERFSSFIEFCSYESATKLVASLINSKYIYKLLCPYEIAYRFQDNELEYDQQILKPRVSFEELSQLHPQAVPTSTTFYETSVCLLRSILRRCPPVQFKQAVLCLQKISSPEQLSLILIRVFKYYKWFEDTSLLQTAKNSRFLQIFMNNQALKIQQNGLYKQTVSKIKTHFGVDIELIKINQNQINSATKIKNLDQVYHQEVGICQLLVLVEAFDLVFQFISMVPADTTFYNVVKSYPTQFLTLLPLSQRIELDKLARRAKSGKTFEQEKEFLQKQKNRENQEGIEGEDHDEEEVREYKPFQKEWEFAFEFGLSAQKINLLPKFFQKRSISMIDLDQELSKDDLMKNLFEKNMIDAHTFVNIISYGIPLPKLLNKLESITIENEEARRLHEFIKIYLRIYQHPQSVPNIKDIGEELLPETQSLLWLLHAVHSPEQKVIQMIQQFNLFEFTIHEVIEEPKAFSQVKMIQKASVVIKQAQGSQNKEWVEYEGFSVLIQVLRNVGKDNAAQLLTEKVPEVNRQTVPLPPKDNQDKECEPVEEDQEEKSDQGDVEEEEEEEAGSQDKTVEPTE